MRDEKAAFRGENPSCKGFRRKFNRPKRTEKTAWAGRKFRRRRTDVCLNADS
jgi:hypothetical protein